MTTNRKVLCFDFDGVIAFYDGWKGFDVFGPPNYLVIEAMRELKRKGYYLTIFTTRPCTQTMVDWLKKYEVPFNSINSNSHNPPMTSQKPIYHAMIDDRAIRYSGQTTTDLVLEIEKSLQEGFKE